MRVPGGNYGEATLIQFGRERFEFMRGAAALRRAGWMVFPAKTLQSPSRYVLLLMVSGAFFNGS
jgi:hypothetical protein